MVAATSPVTITRHFRNFDGLKEMSAIKHERAFFFSDADDSQLCDYGWRLASDKPTAAVRFLRGRKMRTVTALFDEVSAACQFPYYFGENWPAFSECLGDLSWLSSSSSVLIITDFCDVLAEEVSELGAFGRALASAIVEYNREKKNPVSQDSLMQVVANFRSDDKSFKIPRLDEMGSPVRLNLKLR
jgi:hypothetical protein